MPEESKLSVIVTNDLEGDITNLISCSSLSVTRVEGSEATAFNKILDLSPDLVVAVVHNSGKFGINLCGLLKEGGDTRSIPVVFATKDQVAVEEKAAFIYGCIDYITDFKNEDNIAKKLRSYCKLGKLEKSVRRVMERFSNQKVL